MLRRELAAIAEHKCRQCLDACRACAGWHCFARQLASAGPTAEPDPAAPWMVARGVRTRRRRLRCGDGPGRGCGERRPEGRREMERGQAVADRQHGVDAAVDVHNADASFDIEVCRDKSAAGHAGTGEEACRDALRVQRGAAGNWHAGCPRALDGANHEHCVRD